MTQETEQKLAEAVVSDAEGVEHTWLPDENGVTGTLILCGGGKLTFASKSEAKRFLNPRTLTAAPSPDTGKMGGEVEAAWLEAEAQLSEISAAIGSTRFMDPPDGGSVTLPEQVRRMRVALEEAEAALSAHPVSGEGEAVAWRGRISEQSSVWDYREFDISDHGAWDIVQPLYTHPSDPAATERMRAAWRPISEHEGHGPVLVTTRPESPKYLPTEPVTAFKDVTGVWRCTGSVGGGAEVSPRPTHFTQAPVAPSRAALGEA